MLEGVPKYDEEVCSPPTHPPHTNPPTHPPILQTDKCKRFLLEFEEDHDPLALEEEEEMGMGGRKKYKILVQVSHPPTHPFMRSLSHPPTHPPTHHTENR